jgi:dienelactone hydrolase
MSSESFINFLDGYGVAHEPSLTYRDDRDFNAWQQELNQAVSSLRGPVPDRIDLNVEIVESWEEEDHTRQLIRVPVTAFSTLVAYVLLPKGMGENEKRAALVASHGHTKDGIDTTCGVVGMDDDEAAKRAYGLEAVRSGYVVVAPSWWGWLGRDGHLDRVGSRDKCNVIQNAASMYGMNVTDLHIQDGQAAVDVLASHPNVDPGRIGCIGNSYGGRTMMWLALFEPRIKACVPAGCMNTFRERSLKLSSCGIQYLPGILKYADVPDLFSLLAPRAVQLQAGAKDGLITPDDRDAMRDTVAAAYNNAGVSDRFEFVLHPDGHFLKWDLAQPFLNEHLN